MEQNKVFRCFLQDSPLGLIKVTTSSRGLCRIDFDTDTENKVGDTQMGKAETPIEIELSRCLKRYFQGEPESFETVALDIQEGTSFQRAIWKALSLIPYGRVYTYRWLSEKSGHAKAYRAVGQANRKNPVPIVIPCHRILNSDGSLGGYQGKQGVHIKRLLLQLEGAIGS